MEINNIEDIKQDFAISIKEKNSLGIVYTPFFLIKQMLDLIPSEVFNDPSKKWLDMGAGTGYFSIYLFTKLDKGLIDIYSNKIDRHNHIIKNMLYFSEIKEDHINILKEIFGKDANIFRDFLSIENKYISYFDYIIGNPPYNLGQIKTPTNNICYKKNDGITIWPEFVKQAIKLLNKKGHLCIIIPSIWLKPDKIGMYSFLTQYKIKALHTFTNSETNKIFNYQAQTPTCFFLLQKILRDKKNYINIYDKYSKTYHLYFLRSLFPIPLHGISIINKLLTYVDKYGSLKILKTNSPSQKAQIISQYSIDYPYKNIYTCSFSKVNKLQPEIYTNYSNISLVGYKIPKIILAHKMYGFPFLDLSGNYGISARDNYIIQDYSQENLIKIQKFLSTKFALFIYSTTTYRMKYLEKYAFQFIPDISNIKFWQELNIKDINDKTIGEFFNLDLQEREIIEKMHKNYLFF